MGDDYNFGDPDLVGRRHVSAIDLKKEYVLGFLFDDAHETVLLIKKTRPTSQQGKLNGIGGKIEPGETALAAMKREFLEETGFENDFQWRQYASLHFDNCDIYVHSAFCSEKTMSEIVERGAREGWPTDETPLMQLTWGSSAKWMTNLRWLIPMAFDTGFRSHLTITYNEANDKVDLAR